MVPPKNVYSIVALLFWGTLNSSWLMSEAPNESGRLHLRVLTFWVLFFTFVAYLLLTAFLVYQRGGAVQLTLIFGEAPIEIMAVALVLFYLVVDPIVTWYFYRRALRANSEKGYVHALASVVVGVAAPYLYGLLISFMGIMRDIFPVLYIGFFYIAGVVVGLRIIPRLGAHVRSE